MFQLTAEEVASLRSQIATSNKGRGGRRYAPYAFTEQGVAMLSTVLNSERAILVNIEIMRTFVRLRQMLASNTQLARKLGRNHRVRLSNLANLANFVSLLLLGIAWRVVQGFWLPEFYIM